MKKLLTLKHWQLFGILIGIPVIFQVVFIGSLVSGYDPSIMFIAFPIMMILFGGLFFGWLFTLGTNLHTRLPATVKMNLTLFKIFLFVPVVYFVLVSVFVYGVSLAMSVGNSPHWAMVLLIIPLHLFSMFCIFYCLYFNAKALKAVEWQRPVTFSDFAGEFLLMWFFPIGIWVIQPRINKVFEPSAH